MADWSDFAGLTVEEAKDKGKKYGIEAVRIIRVNGEPMMATADYKPNRLNVEISTGDGKRVITGKPYTG